VEPHPFGTRLRARAALFARKLSNATLRGSRNVLFWRRCPPSHPRSIAIHLVGNIGDIVVAIPSLVAIRKRYPRARITLLTSRGDDHLPGAGDILRGAHCVDAIEEYSTAGIRSTGGLVSLLRTVRRLMPELFVMLTPAHWPVRVLVRNLLFARACGSTFVSGLQVDLLNIFLRDQALYLGERPREVDRLLASVRELGLSTADVHFDLPHPDETERSLILEQVANLGGRFAVVCPGGKQTGHLWPCERFGAVAARLRGEANLRLVTIGSGAERSTCERTLSLAGGGVDVSGRLSVLGTAELLRHATLLVTNDTGPMHLAAAVGTPVVAVFSSRDLAGRWYPYGCGHEVFRAKLVCAKCLFASVQTDHCVRHISVDDVWAGCLRVLARSTCASRSVPESANGP
jgi:ADP-heptose:LPS heptosyltransferase